jgi:hypothetical protein
MSYANKSKKNIAKAKEGIKSSFIADGTQSVGNNAPPGVHQYS